MSLSYEDAEIVLKACISKAEELGVRLSIAVVDEVANPVAIARMSGARRGTTSLACQGKAAVAAIWGVPSADTAERMSRNGEIREHAQSAYGHRLLFLGGGLPLKAGDGDDAEVVGAVAASGGSGGQDLEVAQAGVAAFERVKK